MRDRFQSVKVKNKVVIVKRLYSLPTKSEQRKVIRSQLFEALQSLCTCF